MNDAHDASILPALMLKLSEECGGIDGVAGVLQISPSTVRRWMLGQTFPHGAALSRVLELAACCGIPAPAMVRPPSAPGPRPQGRASTLPPLWLALAKACGGVVALADILETSNSTLWRWAHGARQIRCKERDKIRELAGLCGVESPI